MTSTNKKISELRSGERVSLKDFHAMGGLSKARIKTSSKPDQKEKPKNSKYRAKKVEIDGITFDSGHEGARYRDLKVLERVGEIENLRLQVAYPLEINGVLICKYYADFVYVKDGEEVVEDVKGFRTKEYNLKKKMMKAIYGIDIFEYYHNQKKSK
ncbi:DUF1064 domain-containing protein [Vibrio antiquarius]|uniref:DUF1064 domain-containing protein n=1 Tax=Vibrio parahaemolyticus TaxID=670 RepID=A0AA46UR94_VIBPH|nr:MULTISPECIES: DUF1064 domain-containing protein [Vibrio harveyi group]MCS0314074.1 DUF1064 domain-containing protein [Vibrio diabolicus]UYV30452.1 DUF1064 domain-containing protein [Vibrio parahaemolyticus]